MLVRLRPFHGRREPAKTILVDMGVAAKAAVPELGAQAILDGWSWGRSQKLPEIWVPVHSPYLWGKRVVQIKYYGFQFSKDQLIILETEPKTSRCWSR